MYGNSYVGTEEYYVCNTVEEIEKWLLEVMKIGDLKDHIINDSMSHIGVKIITSNTILHKDRKFCDYLITFEKFINGVHIEVENDDIVKSLPLVNKNATEYPYSRIEYDLSEIPVFVGNANVKKDVEVFNFEDSDDYDEDLEISLEEYQYRKFRYGMNDVSDDHT